jgi:competence protein ComEC
VQEQFRRTGTSHHLAISGMHIAILGAVVYALCRLVQIGPRATCWIALAFVLLYALVAVPSPPVVRSAIMCACLAIGILRRRSGEGLQLLSLSVLAMLVYHPLDLFNAGFQLSYGTVLGLILLTRPMLQILPGRDLDTAIARSFQRPTRFSQFYESLRAAARTTIAAGIVAWLVSMPLIAFHFEQLNPFAIPASILLAPFVFVSLIGGFSKVLLTLILPSQSAQWAALATFGIAGMRWMVDLLAKLPGSDIPLPAPPIAMVLLYYVFLLVALIHWPSVPLRWSLRSSATVGCMALAILPLREGLATMHRRQGELKMTLLSVGAGQCAVIEPPDAPAILIDAGSSSLSDILRKALGPFLRHAGRREIGAIFISHANADHFSAVSEIVDAYDVPDVFVAPQFRDQSVNNFPAEAMLRTLDELDHPPRYLAAGDKHDLGGGASLELLWPPNATELDANNSSLVLRLTFQGKTILFTGDIQGPAERALLENPEQLRADVLIAPHHGSSEQTTDAFIRAVSPKFILCSNDRTLSMKQHEFDRITQGQNVYRTHTSGALTVRIAGDGTLNVDEFLR